MTSSQDHAGPDHARSEQMMGRERSLSRRIVVLLIVASVVLIGQSFFNLANLGQVDGSITTVQDAADRLDELSREIAAPIAEIRMLSMESVLAPDQAAIKRARDRLLERRAEIETRLTDWEARLAKRGPNAPGTKEFQNILAAWNRYQTSLEATGYYIERGIRVAAFISVTEQEKMQYEGLDDALAAFSRTQVAQSRSVYSDARRNSTIARYTMATTSLVQIVLLVGVLFLVYRMFRSYMLVAAEHERELARAAFQSDMALELTNSGYFHVDFQDPEYYVSSDRTATLLGEEPRPDYRFHLLDDWSTRIAEVDPEIAEEIRDHYAAAVKGRVDQFDFTYPYKRPCDGRVVWLRSIGSVVRDEQGHASYMYGAIQDVTASRTAESRFRNLLECAPDGMMLVDEEGRIVMVNSQFESLFGYSKEEIIGQPVEVLLPERFRALHVGHRNSFFKHPSIRQMGSGRELFGQRKNGSEFSVEISLSPLQTDDGILASSSIRDITERKRAEAALIEARTDAEAATRAKSMFLANMSHEIRTPMNGVLGMTELALDTDLTPEQRDYLSTVQSSGEALLALINDILDFSKIEAGKLELDPIPFELRDALADMLNSLAARAHSKGLELVYDVPSDVPDALIGDIYRVRQVLVNLVGNAIKFTAAGEIVVTVRQQRRDEKEIELHFAVRDTGVGVPADRLEKIFQPFEQADLSTTKQFGGTGLGLTISTQLAQCMGGRLWAESEVGRGSTFHLTAVFGIGVARPRIDKAEQRAATVDLPVLIVDDNETNRRVLERTTSNWDMRPHTVSSAAEALAAMDRFASAGEPFRLILSDVHMPEVDGFGLFERLQGNPDHKDVPVILLTSASHPGDVARCRELGFAAHLLKPVKQSLLLDAIALAVGAGAAPKTHRPDPSTTPEGGAGGERKTLRILLAEDNATNQKFAVRMIEKAGHSVLIANNGREAVDALAETSYDVVLMDVHMPEMDGYDATAAIRNREKQAGGAAHTPIIAMTANAMKGDRERCLDAGMDGYVSKPVKRATLFTEIDRVLNELSGTDIRAE